MTYHRIKPEITDGLWKTNCPPKVGFLSGRNRNSRDAVVPVLALPSIAAARTWEVRVALFVLILVGVVVAQTWVDWRDTRKKWIVPNWAKGTALAGVIAVSLAAIASFASVWIQDSADQSAPAIV